MWESPFHCLSVDQETGDNLKHFASAAFLWNYTTGADCGGVISSFVTINTWQPTLAHSPGASSADLFCLVLFFIGVCECERVCVHVCVCVCVCGYVCVHIQYVSESNVLLSRIVLSCIVLYFIVFNFWIVELLNVLITSSLTTALNNCQYILIYTYIIFYTYISPKLPQVLKLIEPRTTSLCTSLWLRLLHLLLLFLSTLLFLLLLSALCLS